MQGGQDPTDLTVVVCTLGEAAVGETVESIAASARAAARNVQTVVIWQGQGRPALPDGAEVIFSASLGLSQARNIGLEAARADLVAFVDDDERVDESWVAAALAAFAADPSLEGAFGPVLAAEDGAAPYFASGPEQKTFEGRYRPPWVVGTGGNMVLRRETLVRAGGFDTRYGAGAPFGAAEETDLVMRLLAKGGRLLYTPELTVYHPVRDVESELAARRVYGFGMGAALRRSPLLAGTYLYTIAQELGR